MPDRMAEAMPGRSGRSGSGDVRHESSDSCQSRQIRCSTVAVCTVPSAVGNCESTAEATYAGRQRARCRQGQEDSSHREVLGRYLHHRCTAVHRPSTGDRSREPASAVGTRKTPVQGAQHLGPVTETVPPTYALRCTDRRCLIYPNFKVTQKKKAPGQRLDLGSPWSRLRDSNPRPTHYETVSVRVAWCRVVLPSDVLPDQSTCDWLTCTASYCVVQRRPATGWLPGPSGGQLIRVVGLQQILLRVVVDS